MSRRARLRRTRLARRLATWRHYPRKLRVLSLNTHVGWSIRNGTLAELVTYQRPHILLLQEIRPPMVDAVRRVLGDPWVVRGGPDTVVAVRTHRTNLALYRSWCEDITHGEQHDRRATGVAVADLRSGRMIYAQSVHVAPLGKGVQGGKLGAVRRQARQLAGYLAHSTEQPAEAVVLDGGDFNQHLDLPAARIPARRRRFSVHTRWAKAGMIAAARLAGTPTARLDEVFVRDDTHTRVVKHRVIRTSRPGDDHPAVLVTLRVKPAPTRKA